MEKQIDKYTRTFKHIYTEKANRNYTTTNIQYKQAPHNRKYSLMFQYEATIDAINIKIRNVMNSNQVKCTFHAWILRGQ